MGLLGIAVDPAFQSGSPFIYLYYTHRGAEVRDARGQSREPGFRFTIDGSGGIGGETVLIDNIAAPAGTTTVAICSSTAMGFSMSL